MKKIAQLSLLVFLSIIISACNVSDKNTSLYLLNWGDYISEDLVVKFEKKYNVEVIMSDVESNESMYEQIRNNRTSYDIAVPSDYMIEQLDHDKLLQQIDFSKLKNYKSDNFNFLAQKHGPKSKNYIPYFNGTLGIMYNTKKIKNIEDLIQKNGWASLFDKSIIKDARIGMYNSSRDAFAASLMYNNFSLNSTNPKELDKAFQSLKNMNFEMYGDDNLKKNVVTGNLDLALVYSGDFFEELIVANEEGRDVNFGFYAPQVNNYWLDGMVIPSHSKNTELAYKFLDFMLEENNAQENTEYIGYASPQIKVMENLRNEEDFDFLTLNPFFDPSKIQGIKGESFSFLGLDYMVKLEQLFAKSKKK